MTHRLISLLGHLTLAACALPIPPAYPQDPAPSPTYEIVSIHPHDPADQMSRFSNTNNGIAASNTMVKYLIMSAFGLQTEDQLIGLRGPVSDAHIDIQAKPDADTIAMLKKLTPEERGKAFDAMMRALLEDRFKLKSHGEKREMSAYYLVIAKGGIKLTQADPANPYANGIKGPEGKSMPGMMRLSSGTLTAQAVSISNLSRNLQNQVHRIVFDKTGLIGKYDFELKWAPDDVNHTDDNNTSPPLLIALQEQLGLKLEPTKAMVDVVIIDHIEMPSAN